MGQFDSSIDVKHVTVQARLLIVVDATRLARRTMDGLEFGCWFAAFEGLRNVLGMQLYLDRSIQAECIADMPGYCKYEKGGRRFLSIP